VDNRGRWLGVEITPFLRDLIVVWQEMLIFVVMVSMFVT
jgi:hypothetical protein